MKQRLLSIAYSRTVWFTFGFLLLTAVLLRNAWIGDDAYITLRTVDNFVNGLGLGWNVAERVQAFTHPLWMFLLASVYFFTREAYLTTIIISVLTTILTVGMLIIVAKRDAMLSFLIFGLVLTSKAFIDYSTSGLENPLTHLLLVAFFWQFLQNQNDPKHLLKISFIAGLAILNRMDTALLLMPPLLYLVSTKPNWKTMRSLIIGFSPFIVWELFSLFYFGFLFPNTAYAKLNTGIAAADLWHQGLMYRTNLENWSIPTELVIILGLLVAFSSKKIRPIMVGVGILLYLLYILKIGGCYMSGRFFTAPFIVALTVLIAVFYDHYKRVAIWVLSVVILIGLFSPYTPLFSGSEIGSSQAGKRWYRGIGDERAAWYGETGLLVQKWEELDLSHHPWSEDGQQARLNGEKFRKRSGIGLFGYYAGPDVFIMDNHALTDPLLARLPTNSLKVWRIGHFRRDVPEGYLETLEFGENRITDTLLFAYYEKLRFITRGSLFDWNRIKEIVAFNLGSYNHLLEQYLSQPKKVRYENLQVIKKQGSPFNCKDCQFIGENGLEILFDSIWVGEKSFLSISVDHNDDYHLKFYNGKTIVGEINIPTQYIPERGLRVDELPLPDSIGHEGFDRILITASAGDEKYSIGHLQIHN